MSKVKVFGIGFQKTGTSSLGTALQMLDYRVCFMNFAQQLEAELGEPLTPEALGTEKLSTIALHVARRIAEQHDALQDFPWFIFYKEMDELFPNSKFVLTTRDLGAWVRSMRSYDTTYTLPRAQVVLQWIFGVSHPSQNEDRYQQVHASHLQEVHRYFRDRPNQLLELPTDGKHKMKALSEFLEVPRPRNFLGLPLRYPHKNVGRRNRLINLRNDLRSRLGLT